MTKLRGYRDMALLIPASAWQNADEAIGMVAHLSLRFFGGFEASLNDAPLAFATDKARALLAYLAIESNQAHTRSSLAALLWADYPEENARTTLRHVLHLLRQLLGDDARGETDETAAYLLTTRQTLQFNVAAPHTLDIATFTNLLNQTKTHIHDRLESCSTCLAQLRQAVELYRGNFLGDLAVHDSVVFDEWRTVQQERLRLLAVNALDVLARHAEATQDFGGMATYAQRQIEIDPLGEGAHEQLMRALALAGQRSAAVVHFGSYVRLLRDELGIGPSEALNHLSERIRAGLITPAAPAASAPAASAPAPAASAPVPTSSATATTAPISAPLTHNLPAQLTPFFGREEELAAIKTQLRSAEVDTASRLITLIGWGGSGKTRLAIEAARLCLDDFPDGVYFVSLAALIKPNQIAPAIAASLGLAPSSGNPVNVLQSALRTKHVLLVLDNLEHLLAHPNGDDELGCAALIVQICRPRPMYMC
ncbi:MAG: hypothetical protein HC853_05330 [Anaerolineae bacterium]|nr:hypothetical protein [Anaerolineae bacterium]